MQPSTRNLQRATFNLPTFHVQPSTPHRLIRLDQHEQIAERPVEFFAERCWGASTAIRTSKRVEQDTPDLWRVVCAGDGFADGVLHRYIENINQYLPLAVGLKPSAIQGEARLRGL